MRPHLLIQAALIPMMALVFASSAFAQDADGDGVLDGFDNCIDVENGPVVPDAGGNVQLDTDEDGFGNACDADLNNDGFVDFLDLGGLASVFFTADPDADFNGDGFVDFLDLGRLSAGFFLAPGPTCCEGGPPPLNFAGLTCDSNDPSAECLITVQGVTFATSRQAIVPIDATPSDGPGILVTSDLRIPSPAGDIVLAEASVSFTLASGSGGIGPFESLFGIVRVPFPDLGFMAGVTVDETPMASIGIDFGEFIDVGVPLQPFVSYVFYEFSTGFGASLGPVSFQAGGPSATLVLDPTDPFFFVGGSIGNLIPEADDPPPGGDYGFGISINGQIPFFPGAHDPRVQGEPLDPTCSDCVQSICAADPTCCTTDWDAQCVSAVTTLCGGGDPNVFSGQLLLKGEIPLGTLPLSLNAITIADIDPDMNGTIFAGSPDLELGAKGELAVAVPLVSFFEIGFDLGTADAIIGYTSGDAAACFSGSLDPDDPFAMFPSSFPIPIRQAPGGVGATVRGRVTSANPLDFFYSAAGQFSIDLGPIGAPIGVNLGELASSAVAMDLSSSGLFYSAMTQTQIIPNFTNTEMSLEVNIPTDNFLNTSAALAGAITVAGFGLDPASIFISPLGFEVMGELNLAPVAVLTVDGGVGASGVNLTGEFDSNISYDLQATIDDVLFEAQLAVDIAIDALDAIDAAIDACKDLCPGGCYLNPCCAACDVTFEVPRLAALGVLEVAALALAAVQEAANLFFAALPFDIAGTILANVAVSIDDLDISGAVSASLNGIGLSGSAQFLPPQVCVTLPLGSFPGAGTLGIGDVDFCFPPF